MEKLHEDYAGLPKFRSLLDLSVLAKKADKARWRTYNYPVIALARLTRDYLKKNLIGKDDVRLSNWQLRGDQMTEEQLDCAY